MTWKGTVRGQVIVPEDGADLVDGQTVNIVVENPPKRETWGDVFGDFFGAAKGLPSDFARNHDHYIHGAPKR